MFDFKKILQDLIANALAFGGTLIGASGAATHEETTAIVGGLGAIIGIVWKVVLGSHTRKNVATVSTAVEAETKPSVIVASSAPIVPVGEPAPGTIGSFSQQASKGNYNKGR